MTYALYFNGLGNGETRIFEKKDIAYAAKRGIQMTHISVNWYSGESFVQLLDRMTDLAQQELEKHGKLLLVGSSASGSLVVNILGRLHNPNLTAVTLSSRLNDNPLKWWDRRSMERMAYLGTKHPSQTFFDSVAYCATKTIPNLTDKDKQRIVTVQPLMDFVVPRITMNIPGVRSFKVPTIGHGLGIAAGVRRLPEITSGF